ncbi:ketopantoate reductase PanE/ApbA C terminal-domain-containing protein [Xylariomycetidae sp. FL0641]|nr:ketopantoate reductase PanE/ApbA C terminal-domain-containing protein [Xylariomycetidae sp. FL0641]
MEPIHVLGTGNMGSLFAFALKKSSPASKIVLFARDAYVYRRFIAAGGAIDVSTAGVSEHQTGFDIELLNPQDRTPKPPIRNMIIATKAYDTTEALRRTRDRLNQHSTLLFLQNGMGVVEEVTRELFPNKETRPHFLLGITTHGVRRNEQGLDKYAHAYAPTDAFAEEVLPKNTRWVKQRRSPFSIVHAGVGQTQFGPVRLDKDSILSFARAEYLHWKYLHWTSGHLEDCLVQADMLSATQVSPSTIYEAQLEKLVINSIINPLTVLQDCENGRIFDDPVYVDLAHQLLQEAAPIVRVLSARPGSPPSRAGHFSYQSLWRTVEEVARKTASNKSSMLQDVQNGRPTEIDYINGYIAKKGKELSLQQRTHAEIREKISDITASRYD